MHGLPVDNQILAPSQNTRTSTVLLLTLRHLLRGELFHLEVVKLEVISTGVRCLFCEAPLLAKPVGKIAVRLRFDFNWTGFPFLSQFFSTHCTLNKSSCQGSVGFFSVTLFLADSLVVFLAYPFDCMFHVPFAHLLCPWHCSSFAFSQTSNLPAVERANKQHASHNDAFRRPRQRFTRSWGFTSRYNTSSHEIPHYIQYPYCTWHGSQKQLKQSLALSVPLQAFLANCKPTGQGPWVSWIQPSFSKSSEADWFSPQPRQELTPNSTLNIDAASGSIAWRCSPETSLWELYPRILSHDIHSDWPIAPGRNKVTTQTTPGLELKYSNYPSNATEQTAYNTIQY